MESIAGILAWLDEEPTIARTIAASTKLDALPAEDGRPPIRIAVLRNITLESMVPALKVHGYRAGLQPSVYLGPFDGVSQDVFNKDSDLFGYEPDVIVLALRLQSLAPELYLSFGRLTPERISELTASVLERISAFVRAIRTHSPALVLVHNFELAHYASIGVLDAQSAAGQQNTIRDLNVRLSELAASEGAYVVDIEHLLSTVGYDNGLDDRYWQIGRAPYTPVFLNKLARQYVIYGAALKGRNRKCLVLDCDNTLWGGVVGEDGINGIKLGTTHPGSAYRDFQAAVLDLYDRGVLLAINSKNNEADALAVFAEHPWTLLKPDHFVARRINWQDKATNLVEIAAELNIGLDSLVFVDDNPVECELVRQSLPQVSVVQLPSDPTRFRATLQGLGCFDTLTLSEEDRRRSAMYRQEAQRSELKRQSGTLEDYLRSLEMVLTIGIADSSTIPRIAQLTQKTNQFNVTTRRYTEDDVKRLAAGADYGVYWARLRDRFDDNGLIAVAIVRYGERDAEIDTLLMSCRVIGRGVERALIAHLMSEAKSRGCRRLLGEFIPTAKNGPAAGFFSDEGFEAPESAEDRWWKLSLDSVVPVLPDWFDKCQIEGEGI